MLGVSRESVNKELNVLARTGTIQLSRGSIRLLNPTTLSHLATA
jgi:CRP-like cAMP-binding protein